MSNTPPPGGPVVPTAAAQPQPPAAPPPSPPPSEHVEVRINNRTVLDLTYNPEHVQLSVDLGVGFPDLNGGGESGNAFDFEDLVANYRGRLIKKPSPGGRRYQKKPSPGGQ